MTFEPDTLIAIAFFAPVAFFAVLNIVTFRMHLYTAAVKPVAPQPRSTWTPWRRMPSPRMTARSAKRPDMGTAMKPAATRSPVIRVDLRRAGRPRAGIPSAPGRGAGRMVLGVVPRSWPVDAANDPQA